MGFGTRGILDDVCFDGAIYRKVGQERELEDNLCRSRTREGYYYFKYSRNSLTLSMDNISPVRVLIRACIRFLCNK
jgi:hypothetical protein